MKTYIDKEMCAKCKGQCCKENGCIYAVSDFESMDFEYLKEKIKEGNISISCTPFNGFLDNAWSLVLYLRARNADADIVDLFTKGGPCKMLTENGCKYEEKDRPYGGLGIKPTKIGGPCEKKFNQTEILLKWLQNYEVMELLLKEFSGEELTTLMAREIQNKASLIKEKLKNNEELTIMEKIHWEKMLKIINRKPFYTPEEANNFICSLQMI